MLFHSAVIRCAVHTNRRNLLPTCNLVCSKLRHHNTDAGDIDPINFSTKTCDNVSLNDEEKVTLVKMEYELYKEEGELAVPSELKPYEVQELLKLPSVHGRQRYLRFLCITEARKKKDKEKRAALEEIVEQKRLSDIEDVKAFEEGRRHIVYGLWKNGIFLKLQGRQMDAAGNARVISARMFGQPIVIDNGYDAYMSRQERVNTGQQFAHCIGINRDHREPYFIHVCNYNYDDDTSMYMRKAVPNIHLPATPIEVHKESYLELFPKEKLVYLTPHCNDDLMDYDHEAVYIIGNIVDTREKGQNRSLIKAKKEGILMKRLPLDR